MHWWSNYIIQKHLSKLLSTHCITLDLYPKRRNDVEKLTKLPNRPKWNETKSNLDNGVRIKKLPASSNMRITEVKVCSWLSRLEFLSDRLIFRLINLINIRVHEAWRKPRLVCLWLVLNNFENLFLLYLSVISFPLACCLFRSYQLFWRN